MHSPVGPCRRCVRKKEHCTGRLNKSERRQRLKDRAADFDKQYKNELRKIMRQAGHSRFVRLASEVATEATRTTASCWF